MTRKSNGEVSGKNGMPVVGIRVPSWASFTRPIFHGIVEFIRNREQWRIQTLVDSTNEMAPMVIDENWNGDGLILFRHSEEEAAAFKRRGIPVVNLSTECREKGFPTVIPDNAEIGRMAAQHLLTLGLRHFSYWGDPSRAYSRERGQAFERRIAEAGFECINTQFEPDNLPWEGRWVNVRKNIIQELQRLPKPIGIFAKDDMLGSNIIRICNELDILVPEEVAVMGTNADEVFCQICTPPLSSVAYPGERVGYQAASLLSSMMRGARGRRRLRDANPHPRACCARVHQHPRRGRPRRGRGGALHPEPGAGLPNSSFRDRLAKPAVPLGVQQEFPEADGPHAQGGNQARPLGPATDAAQEHRQQNQPSRPARCASRARRS